MDVCEVATQAYSRKGVHVYDVSVTQLSVGKEIQLFFPFLDIILYFCKVLEMRMGQGPPSSCKFLPCTTPGTYPVLST